MATRAEFSAFLLRLSAAIPRFAPDFKNKAVADVWFEQLGGLGTETLSAIFKHATTRLDAFPSIAQCLGIIGQSAPTDEDKGREVAERIWSAIGKVGFSVGDDWNSWKKAKVEQIVGPIGMAVINLGGGWNRICDTATEDNATTLKAQWRELAAIASKKGGDFGEAPRFDKPAIGSANDIVKRLAEGRDPEDLLPVRK